MNSWILSIVGIVCLSVITDIFIAEGQTNKYIKSIFSLVIVFVVISPLPNILNKNFNIDKLLNSVEADIDLNFIALINKQKCEAIDNIIKSSLSENNIEVKNIDTTCNIFQEDFEILSVYVDISNISVKNSDNFKKKIIKLIQENINISKEQIVFNE